MPVAGSWSSNRTNQTGDTKPEEFPSILDKTICVVKGVSREKFEATSNFTKDKMRDSWKEIEKRPESLRVLYSERVTNLMLEATKPQTSGEPSQSSPGAELPTRRNSVGTCNIANLDTEIRERRKAEVQRLEDEIKGLEVQKKKMMKDMVLDDDRKARVKQRSPNVQSCAFMIRAGTTADTTKPSRRA